jgi:hypothetical protein
MTFAILAYLRGLPTTPLWAFLAFLGFFCSPLFGVRLTAAGVAMCLTFLYAATLAERFGLIPYAPLWPRGPYVGERGADPRLWSSMIWPVAQCCARKGP